MSSPAPPTCPNPGQPDMYGLGIRVAVYMQWFGVVLLEYLRPALLRHLRLLTLLTASALWLALVIQLSGSSGPPLTLADIYLVLLLAAGSYFFQAPIWIWRAMSCFHPRWAPSRQSPEHQSPVFRGCNFVFAVAASSLAIWFWTTNAPAHSNDACVQYGFLFSPVPLSNSGMIAFHSILYIAIVLVCAGILVHMTGVDVQPWRKARRGRGDKKPALMDRITTAQLKVLFSAVVGAALVSAIELTIAWNDVGNVQAVNMAAQTIPLVVTAGIVCRSFFMWFAGLESSDPAAPSPRAAPVHGHIPAGVTHHRQPSRQWRPRMPPPAHSRSVDPAV